MRLVVLGTAGFHPNEQRDTSCYMLPDLGFVLDAGTGMHRVRRWLQTETLDIFLSHAHLDHIVGLTYLTDIVWQRNVSRVTVHGDAAKLASIARHLYSEDLFPLRPQYQTFEIGSEPYHLHSCRVTAFRLPHPGGSLGFRFDWPDRSLAYVTDTTAGPDADYVQAVAGVDLLLHECNFRDSESEWAEKTGHSHTSQVARVAAKAAVGKLLLTHFNPLDDSHDPVGLDRAREIFPNTILAEDGMTVEF